ncbi:MAG: DUF348 domain-containing protein [Actinobacteria bacterium]|nr:MAG: DUF348 domain-containing protein [Actinomycetota bacterium]
MRPSPARVDAPDPDAWLPLPEPGDLPTIEDLIVGAAPPGVDDVAIEERPSDVPQSPARADAPHPSVWLPVPSPDDLPPMTNIVFPPPGSEPPGDDITPQLSPARADAPHPSVWLPVPSPDELTEPKLAPAADGQAQRRAHPFVHLLGSRVARAAFVMLIAATLVGSTIAIWDLVRVKPLPVMIRIDHAVPVARLTTAATVAEFLVQRHIRLGPDDRVVPGLMAALHKDTHIELFRAFPVVVDLDGKVTTRPTTYAVPARFVREQIGPSSRVTIREAPARLAAGSHIVLRTRHSGTLVVDGQQIPYNRAALTVRELLVSYSVTLGPEDKTDPGIDASLTDGMRVQVVRVGHATRTVTVPYSLADETVKDPKLDVEETRVDPGAAGTINVTYEVVQNNGVEVQSTVLSRFISVPARPKVTRIGTHAEPQWDVLAHCESGGHWDRPDVPNGFPGGLGIYVGTWHQFNGDEFAPLPNLATREQQIIVGRRIKAAYGWGAWGCARNVLHWAH